MTLNGVNPDVGNAPVTVQAGSLLIGSTSAFSGTIFNTNNDITVNNGATLGGYGTINATNLTLNAGSTYSVGISGTNSSGMLNVTNNLVVTGSNLIVTSDGTVPSGGGPYTYTIAQYGGNQTGTFASIPPVGLTEILSVNYGSGTADSIVVTAQQASTVTRITDTTGGISDAIGQITGGANIGIEKKFKTLIGVTSSLRRYRIANAIVARFEWRW